MGLSRFSCRCMFIRGLRHSNPLLKAKEMSSEVQAKSCPSAGCRLQPYPHGAIPCPLFLRTQNQSKVLKVNSTDLLVQQWRRRYTSRSPNPHLHPLKYFNSNITWHPHSLTHTERSLLRRQPGLTIWFTGLSASGKSTIATALEQHLLHSSYAAYRLDGDNIRFGLNKDLGFSEKDRNENIRRIAEVALLFADSCTLALTSFISPYRADRLLARTLHEDRGIKFVEVYVQIEVAEAERRDPKGLYKKARAGEIKEFTGVSAPYEEPENAEIVIKSGDTGVEEACRQILSYLEKNGLIERRLVEGKTREGSIPAGIGQGKDVAANNMMD